MKKVILSVVMLFMAMSVFAQEEELKTRVPNGYQGFLEYGNTWHVFDKNMPNTINLSTTHGFYFADHVYAGIGLGFEFNTDRVLVPIYANMRYVFINYKTVSPVLSLRIGSFVGDKVGAYGDLGFGVRFASKRDFAVSVMVAGTYYDKIEDSVWEFNEELGYDVSTERMVSPAGVSLRIGIVW